MRNQFEHIETHNLKRRHLTTIKKKSPNNDVQPFLFPNHNGHMKNR